MATFGRESCPAAVVKFANLIGVCSRSRSRFGANINQIRKLCKAASSAVNAVDCLSLSLWVRLPKNESFVRLGTTTLRRFSHVGGDRLPR